MVGHNFFLWMLKLAQYSDGEPVFLTDGISVSRHLGIDLCELSAIKSWDHKPHWWRWRWNNPRDPFY